MSDARLTAALRIAATLLLIAALVWLASPRELGAAVGAVHAQPWCLAALSIAAATCVGGFNLHLLLREHSGRSLAEFLPVYWIGWAVGLVTPGQVGDLATVSLMLKRRGIDWRGTLGRSLVDKVVSLLVMLAFTAYALVATGQQLSPHLEVRHAAGAALALVAAAAVTFAFLRTVRGRTALGHIAETATTFFGTLRRRPLLVALNGVLSVVKLLLIGAAYWLVFQALGQEQLEFLPTVALSTASGLLAYLPISFNGIGPVEAAGVVLFGIQGIATSTVVAGYLMLRATVLLLAWAPAALFLLATPAQR